MNIVNALSLSREQIKEIHDITNLCRKQDGISLSCPNDGDDFWLLYEGDPETSSIRAFFAVFKTDASCWECYAFTRPDSRGRGYFSALLEAVLTAGQEAGDPDLCFVTDNRCGDAQEILKHLEAEFWYDEYMMECKLDSASGLDLDSASGFDLDLAMTVEDEGPEWGMTLRIAKDGSAAPPAGTCRLSLHGDSAYLYSLEIAPHLRCQGVGSMFVQGIMGMLKKDGCRQLRLQVSGTNEPALRLYRKTGFRITETLSYYLY